MFFSRFAVAMLISLAMATLNCCAWAQGTFTPDEASRFIDTLPEIKAYGEELESNEEEAILKEAMVLPNIDQEMMVNPYSKGVLGLKTADPEKYTHLAGLVGPHGFKTPEDWAHVGDNVTLAVVASEIRKQPQGIVQMGMGMDFDSLPPEMAAFLSPKMKQQLKAAQRVARQSETVSDEDIATIEPLMPKLKAMLK